MQPGDKINLLRIKIHELTHGGADYYAKYLKSLRIDEGSYFSYATTHPTIAGNESFHLELVSSEWQYTYYDAGSSYHGDVIDFYRLVHGLDEQTSEDEILCLINDEMGLGLIPNNELTETDVVHTSTVSDNTVESANPDVDRVVSTVEDTSVQTTYGLVATNQVTESAVEQIDEQDPVSEPPTELPVVPSIISKCDGTTVSHATSDVIPMSVSGEHLVDDIVETEFKVQSENDATGNQDSESDQGPDSKRNKPGVGFVSALDLLNMEITDVPCIVNPLLPMTGLAAVVGSSDSGKSCFTRQLAIAICTGDQEFLGFELRPRHGRAIFVSSEDDMTATAALIRRQVKQSGQNNGAIDNLTFLFDTSNVIKKLNDELTNNPADLVICDSYGDLFDRRDSNSNVLVRQFLSPFGRLANAHECLILFIHHTGKKTDGNDPSKHNVIGSQAFEAKMRVVLDIRQDEFGRRLLSPVKGNYLSQSFKKNSFVMAFDEVSLTFTMTDEQVGHSQGEAKKSTKLQYTVDWSAVYGDEKVLRQKVICGKLNQLYDMPYGTAITYIKTQLDKVPAKVGFYQQFHTVQPGDGSQTGIDDLGPMPGPVRADSDLEV